MRRSSAATVWAILVLGVWVCGCEDGLGGGILPPASAPAPDNANVTILLFLVRGPNHTADAEAYKNTVAKETGWRDLFLVHEAEWSELYRGRYLSASQAQRDLKASQTWRDSQGATPFARALVMPLPAKDVGPPEWNLLRTSGMFTVTVAEFYDVPESSYVGRRDFAVQYCRQLRARNMQAYYYHGPTKSFVCVGSYPESAYPSVNQGGVFKRVSRDARIDKTLKEFPFLAVNGRQEVEVVQSKEGKPVRLATASYVMEIPR
jgi:hypothetical protein